MRIDTTTPGTDDPPIDNGDTRRFAPGKDYRP